MNEVVSDFDEQNCDECSLLVKRVSYIFLLLHVLLVAGSLIHAMYFVMTFSSLQLL